MKLETIRLVAAAAADPTLGVNAMLAGLTLMTGDPRPANVTIYNAADHGWVARRMIPEEASGITFPALAVFLVKSSTFDEVPSQVRDGHLPIGLAYVENASDSAKGNRDAMYTEMAILRFLARLESPAADSLRQVNDVGLVYPDSTEQPPVDQPWGSGLVTALTITTWTVRDNRANPPV